MTTTLVAKAWAAVKSKELEIVAKLSAKLDDKVDQVKVWAKEKLSEWKDKKIALSAAAITTVGKVVEWWNNRASRWKSKTAAFWVKASTSVGKVKEWWNNRALRWKSKTASFGARASTTISTVKEWWSNRAAHWKDKTISFKIKVGASVQEIKDSFKSAINIVIGWINTYIIDNLNKISITIPKIKAFGKTLYDGNTFGFDINHISTFATGGFPEDGLFMANHGELVGKFSNGKTAVANNAQIVEGIEAGVYRAVTAANSSGGKSGGNTPVINVYVGGKQVTDVVVKDINDRTIQTGKNPLLV